MKKIQIKITVYKNGIKKDIMNDRKQKNIINFLNTFLTNLRIIKIKLVDPSFNLATDICHCARYRASC